MDVKPLWVFGYGSLMWNPGFAYASRQTARVTGYRRWFCMHSIHYRGTPSAPGLVLALDEHTGGLCDGVAFEVPGAGAAMVADYLRRRELISSAYLERELPVVLPGGAEVRAITFVINPDHAQYCGHLTPEQQAGVIAASRGENGPNDEYLFNTADHLAELGIADPDLVWLAARVREIRAAGRAGPANGN